MAKVKLVVRDAGSRQTPSAPEPVRKPPASQPPIPD
jgi:hypothetical protein